MVFLKVFFFLVFLISIQVTNKHFFCVWEFVLTSEAIQFCKSKTILERNADDKLCLSLFQKACIKIPFQFASQTFQNLTSMKSLDFISKVSFELRRKAAKSRIKQLQSPWSFRSKIATIFSTQRVLVEMPHRFYFVFEYTW